MREEELDDQLPVGLRINRANSDAHEPLAVFNFPEMLFASWRILTTALFL
jgi:hypothetical protein